MFLIEVPILAALADENEAEFFGGMTVKERAALERALKASSRATV